MIKCCVIEFDEMLYMSHGHTLWITIVAYRTDVVLRCHLLYVVYDGCFKILDVFEKSFDVDVGLPPIAIVVFVNSENVVIFT